MVPNLVDFVQFKFLAGRHGAFLLTNTIANDNRRKSAHLKLKIKKSQVYFSYQVRSDLCWTVSKVFLSERLLHLRRLCLLGKVYIIKNVLVFYALLSHDDFADFCVRHIINFLTPAEDVFQVQS